MRDYAKVAPTFWTGKTGRAIRGDASTQILALYLMSSPHASMTGVYHCPVVYMAHETGLDLTVAEHALTRLQELGFCQYDHDNELVWVCEMARFQIGEGLKDGDRRVKGVERELDQVPSCDIKRGFLDRYKAPYGLEGDGVEAPSRPLRSQEQAQEQEQEHEVARPRAPVTTPPDLEFERKKREYADCLGDLQHTEGALDITPLTALEAKGYDWSKDILQPIRERIASGKPLPILTSASYWKPMIEERHAIPEKPAAPPTKPVTWISVDDERWDKLAALHADRYGKPPIALPGKETFGKGFRFDNDLVAGVIPAFLRRA